MAIKFGTMDIKKIDEVWILGTYNFIGTVGGSLGLFIGFSYTKVIKEKWGQYFAIDHFYTPLCSNRNGHIVIKKFLEQKFAKSSVINLVPNA